MVQSPQLAVIKVLFSVAQQIQRTRLFDCKFNTQYLHNLCFGVNAFTPLVNLSSSYIWLSHKKLTWPAASWKEEENGSSFNRYVTTWLYGQQPASQQCRKSSVPRDLFRTAQGSIIFFGPLTIIKKRNMKTQTSFIFQFLLTAGQQDVEQFLLWRNVDLGSSISSLVRHTALYSEY